MTSQLASPPSPSEPCHAKSHDPTQHCGHLPWKSTAPDSPALGALAQLVCWKTPEASGQTELRHVVGLHCAAFNAEDVWSLKNSRFQFSDKAYRCGLAGPHVRMAASPGAEVCIFPTKLELLRLTEGPLVRSHHSALVQAPLILSTTHLVLEASCRAQSA